MLQRIKQVLLESGDKSKNLWKLVHTINIHLFLIKEVQDMTTRMNAILGRVLSQELAKQEVWGKQDIANGFPGRDDVIKEIKDFMEENNIKFRKDFYYEQRSQM